jgi:hypothetical protein
MLNYNINYVAYYFMLITAVNGNSIAASFHSHGTETKLIFFIVTSISRLVEIHASGL